MSRVNTMIMKTTLHRIVRKFYSFANHYILPIFEVFLYKKSHESIEYPPIFIIGAPRSGSTLLIQAIVSALILGISAIVIVSYMEPGIS